MVDMAIAAFVLTSFMVIIDWLSLQGTRYVRPIRLRADFAHGSAFRLLSRILLLA
jgi:hypothetical protein